MDAGEKEYLYWLCHITPLGAVSIRKLYEYFGSFREIWRADEKTLESLDWLGEKKRLRLLSDRKRLEETRREYEALSGKGIRFVTFWEEEYPKRLCSLPDRPPGLFVKGSLPEDGRPSAAIVGARGCTEYGRQTAKAFAGELAERGVQIISGLAEGIDAAAHRGALLHGGRTFGVLGCGVNICYPAVNFSLYEEMAEKGGVFSEFLPGTSPFRGNFPLRNRLISGLADAVIIIEAREKSGSLITADLALEQGKEVFAVPGRVSDPLSAGTNRLLQSGAAAALTPSDILDFLGIKYVKKLTLHKKSEKRLAKKENLVYSCLDLQPKHLDTIMQECGLGIGECMECLLELELSGLAVENGNQYYCRKL